MTCWRMLAGLREVVDRQHLFSVYVHLPPNKTLSGPPSIFHGREIPGSISTAWGEWSLANASRVLLRRAPVLPCSSLLVSVICSRELLVLNNRQQQLGE
jgi:hypothetical protein